ncbi:MAG: ATP-dependent Clp protease proteolytic subunit [Anaerolineae bacterium]|jgi:ClpP class serine protease
MQFTDIFWILIVAASVLPALRQRLLDMARLRKLRELEKKRNSRVIALIHRQETMAVLGIPLFRYIDIDDSEQILRAIRMTAPGVPIDLVLHTPGGLVLAAEQIAYALCAHKADVTVFVPHYAMSGGTLIALAADQVVMDDNAVLGPVDPQLQNMPAASILAAVSQKDANELDDETLVLADVGEKAIKQVKQTVIRIVSNRADREQAEKLAEVLATGTWTHDYPITVSEARDLGIPVDVDVPKEVYELMDLYPQTAQRRPSVQYIPMPYRGGERPPSAGGD